MPEGSTGSITHTKNYARAMVATVSAKSRVWLRIDSEQILSSEVAKKISRFVLTKQDLELFETKQRLDAQLDFSTFVTCAFSVKETLLKALSSQIKLGFRSIYLAQLCLDRNVFSAFVMNNRSHPGLLSGKIDLQNRMIHTDYVMRVESNSGR